MFNCKFVGCEHVSENVCNYVQHTKLHSNAPNYHYQCGVPNCSRRYRKHTGLQIHMYRQHRSYLQAAGPILPGTSALPPDTPLKCLLEACAFKCDTLASLIKHLKTHIRGGMETRCPFRGCDCKFTWHVDFRLNWDQVSSAIRLRVEKEERPLPDERKAFVIVLVDQMMQHDRNPTRAMCHSVVRNIVRSHPKSFGDIGKHGDIAGDGCHSLLQQVKTRVEYKNRNNTLAQRRRERRPHTGMAGEARLARGPVDQNGCVRWGPADLPEGETEATLENMKRDLLNIYSGMPSTVFLKEGMSGAERAEPMMEKTYVILRKYLNKVPAAAMSEIKQEWPFLFSQKCLFSHFGLLTDVNVLQKLQEAISRRGQTILDYCATLDNPKIRDVLACYDPDSDKAACILLLLMLYFKEPKESLMLEVDPCATAVDVNTAELPSTPCLIIQGDMMKPSGWLLSIEGHVVMGPHPFFLHGVAAFFSSYYVFNLEYPAAGSSTLEFIQRCFLGINPERGSKTKKRTTMNPHVSTLLRKLIDFEWAS